MDSEELVCFLGRGNDLDRARDEVLVLFFPLRGSVGMLGAWTGGGGAWMGGGALGGGGALRRGLGTVDCFSTIGDSGMITAGEEFPLTTPLLLLLVLSTAESESPLSWAGEGEAGGGGAG